jgi:hypothetical protein
VLAVYYYTWAALSMAHTASEACSQPRTLPRCNQNDEQVVCLFPLHPNPTYGEYQLSIDQIGVSLDAKDLCTPTSYGSVVMSREYGERQLAGRWRSGQAPPRYWRNRVSPRCYLENSHSHITHPRPMRHLSTSHASVDKARGGHQDVAPIDQY